MSHEIYYTSAPEGLKRGTSGFSTVGSSPNIPRALWDRLETLSAYRHQFASGAGENPVSLAHWILNLSGKTHHVLSRICDSGVDHTQRTNAFAHHLVVETGEIEKAGGGPAWMLRQPGVMAQSWDGRVGVIERHGLPAGDEFAVSKICRGWEAATGDAGWGGHLADLFAKSPLRPVCILFSPGQDVFRLLDEAIMLLPPAARWNVTFNTYFTSMPTSATCLWRCCLAGTQAAQVGLRYAASGLVLDLTDRSRLPALPAGPYVTMARTGEAVATPQAAAKPMVRVPPTAPAGPKAPPVYDPEVEQKAREEAERNRLLLDFDDLIGTSIDGTSAPAADVAVADAPYALGSDHTTATPGRREMPARRIMRRAEDVLEAAEREEAETARRRRKQVLMLFAGAVTALAVGTGLVLFLNARSAPPEPPVKDSARGAASQTTEPVAAATAQTVPAIVSTASAVATTAGSVMVNVPPVQTGPVTPIAPVKTYPDLLTAQAMLERPNIGTGIGDRVQTLPLKGADLDPAPIAGVKFAFPPTTASKTPSPAASATYAHETLGTLMAQADVRLGKPGIVLRWKAPNDPVAEALFIGIDRTAPLIEMRWHSALLLKNPGSFSFMFWTLQNSVLELDTPRATRQRVVFKPFVPAPVTLADVETDFKWPVELPRETTASAPAAGSLPEGWKADWYPDWTSKDPAQRTADNALQVIKFKKPTAIAAVDAWFLLTFTPGLAKVQSNFAKRLDSDKRDLAQFEQELRGINQNIEQAKVNNGGVLGDSQGSVELRAQHDQTAALVDAYKAAIAGYNELKGFDIPLGLSDGMQLTTLHFQAGANETGK